MAGPPLLMRPSTYVLLRAVFAAGSTVGEVAKRSVYAVVISVVNDDNLDVGPTLLVLGESLRLSYQFGFKYLSLRSRYDSFIDCMLDRSMGSNWVS